MKVTTSGIRGVFGADLGLKDVLAYAGNFAALAGGRCAVGMDTRPSGPMVHAAAKAALMGGGVDVYDLGVAPTPVILRESRRHGAGLVATASHNPIEWNGLKLALGGRMITEAELQQVTAPHSPTPQKAGTEHPTTSNYVDDALGLVGRADHTPDVIVDAGGGAAAGVAPELLSRMGCNVTTINQDPGCKRGPDPTTDPLTELCGSGKTGFAFDLDGDRLVLVHGGKKQSPDVTLGLGIARALEMGRTSFVLSVDTSVGVEKMITDGGGRVQYSKVGEANVVDLMEQSKAQAGGEGSSGGFILSEFNRCRDGILASGLIASMVGTPAISEVLERMSGYVQSRQKVPADSKLHQSILERLEPKFGGMFSETSTLDGLRGRADEGSWVLVRPSNTEDAIRVSAESKSADSCERLARNVAKMVGECRDDVR